MHVLIVLLPHAVLRFIQNCYSKIQTFRDPVIRQRSDVKPDSPHLITIRLKISVFCDLLSGKGSPGDRQFPDSCNHKCNNGQKQKSF